jgi:tRNA nucleotidyltransferase (CCA-adding enzyme)
LPAERIQAELNKILLFPHVHIATLFTLGLMPFIVPELVDCFSCEQETTYHVGNVGKHTSVAVSCVEPQLHLRLAMLFHDIGKPSTKTIDEEGRAHFYQHHVISAKMAQIRMRKLKYSCKLIDQVIKLILNHNKDIMPTNRSVRRLLSSIGLEAFIDLLKIKEADLLAQSALYYGDRHQALEDVKVILMEILNENQCFSKKDLALNGTDLLLLGIPEGKRIGHIIEDLFKMVVDSPKLNQKEILLHIVKEHYMEEGDLSG